MEPWLYGQISTNASIIGTMDWDHVGSGGWTMYRRSCSARMVFRQGCFLHLCFCTCFHWDPHRHACSVICLCPPVRTEGRLALLKSLMACLWHPLWTPGWTKGHIYFWPADVENGAAQIIDFPFFSTSSALFLLLVIRLLVLSLLLFLPHHHVIFTPPSPTWLFARGWRRPTWVWGYIGSLHNRW